MIQQTFASPEKFETNSAVSVMPNIMSPNIFNTMFLEEVKTKLLKRSKTRITVWANIVGQRRVDQILDFGVAGNRNVSNAQTNKLPDISPKKSWGLPNTINPVAEVEGATLGEGLEQTKPLKITNQKGCPAVIDSRQSDNQTHQEARGFHTKSTKKHETRTPENGVRADQGVLIHDISIRANTTATALIIHIASNLTIHTKDTIVKFGGKRG